MTWILKLCAEHWREVLIALLFAALTLSINLGRQLEVKYHDNDKEWSVKFAKLEQSFASQVALAREKENEATKRYAASVATIKVAHAENLKAAEQNAYRNYLARYGRPDFSASLRDADPAGVRITLPADPPGTRAHESAGPSDAATRDFVASCARDAARLNEWVQLCTLNNCEVIP